MQRLHRAVAALTAFAAVAALLTTNVLAQSTETSSINYDVTHAKNLGDSNLTRAMTTAPEPSTTSNSDGPSTTPSSTYTTTTIATEPASLTIPIAGGGAGVLIVVLIVVVVVVMRRRCKSARRSDARDDYDAFVSHEATLGSNSNTDSHDVPIWQDTELRSLKMDSDDIQDIRKLGNGAFADVWLVKFRGAEFLASKRLRTREVDHKRLQKFIDEIKLVAKLNHPNVVELKGVAWIRKRDVQALFEYMDGGDLRVYLTNPNVPMRWSAEKLQIAVDVIEALVYLHSLSPPLVHRDLKSRNVLLSSGGERSIIDGSSSSGGMRAKLTDFGVSRYRSQDRTMTAGVGTGRWLAPEVISGNDDYGPAADIFSFGAVLSELDSHQLPYADVRATNGNALPDVVLLQRVAAGELVPSMNATCPPKIAALASQCTALQPADRPTAPEVAYTLRSLQKEIHRGSSQEL